MRDFSYCVEDCDFPDFLILPCSFSASGFLLLPFFQAEAGMGEKQPRRLDAKCCGYLGLPEAKSSKLRSLDNCGGPPSELEPVLGRAKGKREKKYWKGILTERFLS